MVVEYGRIGIPDYVKMAKQVGYKDPAAASARLLKSDKIKSAIADAFEAAKAIFEKPTVIIAHTIAGKGVPEFERDYRWHGVPPGAGPEDVVSKKEQGKVALHELRTLGGKIRSEHE